MKEQLRTEAEKVLTEKGMNCAKLRNTFTLDGNDDSFLDRIINAMLDFHAQQLEKDNWVSVSERLPELKQYCLVSYDGHVMIGQLIKINKQGIGLWDNPDWFTSHSRITHWQPLPKSPTTTQTL